MMHDDLTLHGDAPRKLTLKHLAANRRNARLGGVKTPEGKAVSRHNARKHGIFASAFTQLDHRELRPILDDLMEQLQPVGPIESALVEKLALLYLRMQRCARAEAEYHTATWAPDLRRRGRMNPGSTFKPWMFERTVELVNRYDVSLTNQFVRLMHELERLRRLRGGEKLPPPGAADIGVFGG